MEKICPFCGKQVTLTGDILGSEYHNEFSPRVTYSYIYRQKFDNGHIRKFSMIPMYCSRCGAHIKLKSNPIELLDLAALIILLFNAIFIAAKKINAYVLLFSVFLILLLSVITFFRWQWIKKWRSNFEIADKNAVSDNLVFVSLRRDRLNGRAKKSLYETNILWAEIPGNKIYF